MAGELLLDRPADGVLRLTISNPAKRNALDHPILDAIAAVLDDIGDARVVLLTGADGMFSSGYDIGDIPEDVFAQEAERLVAHPFAAALEALDDLRGPDRRRAAGPHHRRRPRARARVRPARRRRRDPARHAAGQARPRLLPHRPAALPGRHRRAAHARAVPHRRRNVDARTALGWGLVNQVVGVSEPRDRRARPGAGPRRQRAAERARQQARDPRRCWPRRAGSTPRSSASSSSCARPASSPRTCARACARSARSAPRAGRAADAVKLVTWNVNSLNARLPRVLEFLDDARARRRAAPGDQDRARRLPGRRAGGRRLRARSTTAPGAGRASPSSPARASRSPTPCTACPASTAPRRRAGSRPRRAACASPRTYVTNGRAVGTPTFAEKLAFLDAMRDAAGAATGRPRSWPATST